MKRGDVVEVVLPAQTTVDVVEQTTSLIEVPLATVRGLKGDAATIAVGSVTTGEPGTAASVTNSGTPGSAVLDFVIPRGDKGDTGTAGHTPVRGTDYWTTADQSAIVSDVQASLGDLAMQDTITHTQVSDWSAATVSFLTEHQSLDGLATEAYVDAAIAAITDADSKSY